MKFGNEVLRDRNRRPAHRTGDLTSLTESCPPSGDARLSQSQKGIGACSPLESSYTKHYRHFDSASFADWRALEPFVKLSWSV